jgi:hypothetical protein
MVAVALEGRSWRRRIGGGGDWGREGRRGAATARRPRAGRPVEVAGETEER